MERSQGLAAVASLDARILVLGSLPGQQSLKDQEYYAHPQNVFWPVMNHLFGICGNYAERCSGLKQNKLALWDVLQASVRPGSLDANIRLETAVANDFSTFIREFPVIEQVVFNGKKAEQLFRRLVPRQPLRYLRFVSLPSTSPAYAAMPFGDKLSAWKAALASLCSDQEKKNHG